MPKSPGCSPGPLDTHTSTCLGLPHVQALVRNRVAAGRYASFLWTLLKSEFLLINTAQGLSTWNGCLYHGLSQHMWLHSGLGWVSPGLAEES